MEQNQAGVSLNLRPHQEELLQLSELAGIHADPSILKIIVELLNMQVSPGGIFSLLKTVQRSIRAQKRLAARKSMSNNSSS